MRVLATGGAGYIGSHTVLELLRAGHEVVVLDDLSNSSPDALQRVAKLAGRSPKFVKGDINDASLLRQLFTDYCFDSVVHFAGLKSVGESARLPLKYYHTNVSGTLNLCQTMADAGVFRLVFSSSATVYGEQSTMPIAEEAPVGVLTNPYGRSKWMVEQMLQDLARSDSRWSVALLRYFNPVGADASGEIGEDPHDTPNNLVPYISQVAIGKRPKVQVFGDDYDTRDGTGIRDYIHVADLAKGHLAALHYIEGQYGARVWNLGTGRGYTVLEIIKAFEVASGHRIPYQIVGRRPGDIAESWADPTKAIRELGWQSENGLAEMMEDTWRWQSKNPDGYNRF